MLEFAHALPGLRERAAEHLAEDGPTRERVLACATRLLDRGFFRMGTEGYAEQNQTYGLATIQKCDVRLDGDLITFDYVAKSGKRRLDSVLDPAVSEVVARSGGAAAAPTCRQARPGGWTSAPTTSTPTSRSRPAATSPPRTSAPSATVLVIALASSFPRPGPRGRPGSGRSAGRWSSRRSPTPGTPRR